LTHAHLLTAYRGSASWHPDVGGRCLASVGVIHLSDRNQVTRARRARNTSRAGRTLKRRPDHDTSRPARTAGSEDGRVELADLRSCALSPERPGRLCTPVPDQVPGEVSRPGRHTQPPRPASHGSPRVEQDRSASRTRLPRHDVLRHAGESRLRSEIPQRQSYLCWMSCRRAALPRAHPRRPASPDQGAQSGAFGVVERRDAPIPAPMMTTSRRSTPCICAPSRSIPGSMLRQSRRPPLSAGHCCDTRSSSARCLWHADQECAEGASASVLTQIEFASWPESGGHRSAACDDVPSSPPDTSAFGLAACGGAAGQRRDATPTYRITPSAHWRSRTRRRSGVRRQRRRHRRDRRPEHLSTRWTVSIRSRALTASPRWPVAARTTLRWRSRGRILIAGGQT